MRFPLRLIDPRFHRNPKKKNLMTYIMAGKLKGNPFLMVDSIGLNTVDPTLPTFIFTNKLGKFASLDDVYFCVTGDAYIQSSIELLDKKNYLNKTKINYDNQSFIEDVFFFYRILDASTNTDPDIEQHAKIFMVDSKDITYYTLTYSTTKLEYSKHNVQDNCFIAHLDGKFTTDNPISSLDQDLYTYCSNHITSASPMSFNDRFSFVKYENKKSNYIKPYKKDEDMVAEFLWGNFNDLT